jgi:Raf kinase inhibitor-like YbhB/YbcL family protein
MAIALTSTSFLDGERIPSTYTCDGADISPPLSWGQLPKATQSLALICDDPDAPRRFTHWVLFNIPPDSRELHQGISDSDELENGARQGVNDFGLVGYGGPCPPGGSPHRYYFTVYALDAVLDLPAGTSKKQLLDGMESHVLGEGQLVGLYQR